MKKEVRRLIKKIENLDWTVTEEGANQYMLSKFSPAGQDFNIYIEGETEEDLIDSIYERYENFDVSEETYLWLDDTGHGANGAPYDMRDLYNDMEACEQMILELYNEL
ncbi:hypothetical protein ACR77J_07885 [Tissierella praeacuta]|uniref:hypothetical protein n=1 Tax=Tissierella praeacuta TaxID=43131 RepID=UPI003DA4EE65